MTKVLLGNTFPLTLVRREVRIYPITVDEAKALLTIAGFNSFWGHTNTATVAKAQLGFDVMPKTERPALVIDEDGLPGLNGEHSDTIVVLSPTYRSGFRPAMGQEVTEADIVGWEPLLVKFTNPAGIKQDVNEVLEGLGLPLL